MGLREYKRKRDFERTPEPRGKPGKGRRRGLGFVIQKHAARALHYDFRLELDGVLLSWAVPKGPRSTRATSASRSRSRTTRSTTATSRAVIPKGEYGGGTVLLWDRGTWEPEGDAHAGPAKGDLEFTLDGEKLHGRWVLVRMRAQRGRASRTGSSSSTRRGGRRGRRRRDHRARPESVASGRTIEEIGRRPVAGSGRATGGRTEGRTAAPARPSRRCAKARRGALPGFVPAAARDAGRGGPAR